MIQLTEKDIQRFHSKIFPDPFSDCLIWEASCNEDGYGMFRLNGKMEKAHRIAFFLATGIDPGNL